MRVMNARNRHRFRNDEQVLGAWVNASTVAERPVAAAGDGGVTPALVKERRPVT